MSDDIREIFNLIRLANLDIYRRRDGGFEVDTRIAVSPRLHELLEMHRREFFMTLALRARTYDAAAESLSEAERAALGPWFMYAIEDLPTIKSRPRAVFPTPESNPEERR